MLREIYKINVNIRVNRTQNWLSNPRGPIDNNLAESLQRSVVREYEGKRKYSNFKINNTVPQIMSGEHHFSFH
jgi:hypothetical protein